MKYLFFIVFFVSFFGQSQVAVTTDTLKTKEKDSLVIDSGKKDSLKIFKPTIYDYQFQKEFSRKNIIDTVFSHDKTYIFSQYNNKDNFGKIQFSNIGAGFNPLVFELNTEGNLMLLPTNKSFGILGSKEINYFDVKTPTTTFIYHNGVKNGGSLQSTYTQNIGKNFNFALQYEGLRSKGAYLHSLAASNNTIFSGRYISKNNHYIAFAHYLHQNVNNEENGGIKTDSLFINGDASSTIRSNMQVNLQNSNSKFSSRRYYLTHQFTPFNSEKFPFKIRHTIYEQTNKYYYSQNTLESYYYSTSQDLVDGYSLSSGKFSSNFSNTLSVLLDKEKLKFSTGIRYQILKMGVSEGLSFDTIIIPQEIKENRIGAVANLELQLGKKVHLNSDFEFSQGNQFGVFIKSNNDFQLTLNKDYSIDAKLNFQSASPNFNYLLNPSIYKKFNFNFLDAKNQTVTEFAGNLQLKWFNSKANIKYFRIDHFTYFDEVLGPKQSESSVTISQIGGEATFNYHQFFLHTQLLFQNTLTNKDLFPAPQFIGRFNLFYQAKAFKKAAEIQTGIKTYYFSTFSSRAYFPVLNEFVLSGNSPFTIGGKPIVDAYFNMKVKRMFFFIETQNLTDAFSVNRIYTAPHYPYSDFRVNIGIVWYLIN